MYASDGGGHGAPFETTSSLTSGAKSILVFVLVPTYDRATPRTNDRPACHAQPYLLTYLPKNASSFLASAHHATL